MHRKSSSCFMRGDVEKGEQLKMSCNEKGEY